MYRKYEKTFRVVSPQIRVQGKFNLSHDEQRQLLRGKVEITEKMDGANVGIVRGKGDKWTLQKRRGLAEEGVHQQYSFFWNWARYNQEKILAIPEKWIVYGELCWAQHNIFYDELPSYFLVFDIWDGKHYLDTPPKLAWANRWGFETVPLLYSGKIETEELDSFMNIKSEYASESIAEGIVIKNYKQQLRGKLVRPEFMKELDEDDHWVKHSIRKNQLKGGLDWYD